MADAQVLLKHDVTGHSALFPAAADMDTWHALGWHEIPDESLDESSGEPDDKASADAEKTTTRSKAAPKRGDEPKEKA